jgi:putative Mg2+ transporter-C (MgtC) family protein
MELKIFVLRMVVSLCLGAIIGIERELTQKSAGLRTHILVTFSSTLLTILALSDFYEGLPNHLAVLADPSIKKDPSRIPAQIVSGIGFIGGGAVLKYGSNVRGLTTAASILTAASIGMLTGIGQYKLAVLATLLTFMVLLGIGHLERRAFRKGGKEFNRLSVNLVLRADQEDLVQSWVESYFEDEIVEAQMIEDANTKTLQLNYVLSIHRNKTSVKELNQKLISLHGVQRCSLKAYQEAAEE